MRKLFGTDGIRGEVGKYPLTEEMVFKIGKAVGLYISRTNPYKRKTQKTIISKDTRLTGELFENALSRGISQSGVNVDKISIMPTPAVAYLARRLKFDMGIVISASHNSITDNGLKFFSHLGYKISDKQEEEIERILFEELGSVSLETSGEDNIADGRIRDRDEKEKYLDFLKTIVSGCDFSNLKLVIDCGYGATSHIAPDLFKELSADVTSLNDNPNGANINQNCGALFPEILSAAVKEKQAGCGFSFDGDGDRVIACDEKGKVLDGDYLLAIIADYMQKRGILRKGTIVATQMSNIGLEICVSQWGGKLIRANVGDKLVLNKMMAHKLNLGGEQSGHIIPLDYTTTGDGLLTALLILKIMSDEKRPLSELARCMYKFPQVLVNIKVDNKRPLEEMPKFSKLIEKGKSKLGTAGRIYIRYSGTEKKLRIMVEGQDQLLVKDIAENLASTAKEELAVSV